LTKFKNQLIKKTKNAQFRRFLAIGTGLWIRLGTIFWKIGIRLRWDWSGRWLWWNKKTSHRASIFNLAFL